MDRFRYDLERPQRFETDEQFGVRSEVLGRLRQPLRPQGLPFLIGPGGRPDGRIDAFFDSRRMRACSPLTWRKYAYSLGLWLNFLVVLGRAWDEATGEDADYFKEWRLTEEANPRPVDGSTFRGDLAGLRTFYRWAGRQYGVRDPVVAAEDLDLRPRGARDKDIKWLDPGGYRRWRDLGLRGLDRDAGVDSRWRGRNEQRDAAFADGLYGTGLRSRSGPACCWPSCRLSDSSRGYSTCRLADACGKGGSEEGDRLRIHCAGLEELLRSYATVINELDLENRALREQLTRQPGATVTPIRRRQPP